MSNTINPSAPQKVGGQPQPIGAGAAPLATGPTSLQVGVTRALAGEAVAGLKDATAVLDGGKAAATSEGIVQRGASGIEQRAATALGALTSFLEAKPQAKASAAFDHPALSTAALAPSALLSTLKQQLGTSVSAQTATATTVPTTQQQKSEGLRMAIKDAIALDQTRMLTAAPSLVATTIAQSAEKAGLKQAAERAAASIGSKQNKSTRMETDPYVVVDDPGVQSKLEGVFSKMGDLTSMGDIDMAINLLMMLIAKDAEQDLRAIADDMKKNLNLKKKLRDLKATQKDDNLALRQQAQSDYANMPEAFQKAVSFETFWKAREVTVFEPVINQDSGEILYQKPELGAMDDAFFKRLGVDPMGPEEAPPEVHEKNKPSELGQKILDLSKVSVQEQQKQMVEKVQSEAPDWEKITQNAEKALGMGLYPGSAEAAEAKKKAKQEKKTEGKSKVDPSVTTATHYASSAASAGNNVSLVGFNTRQAAGERQTGEEKIGPGGMKVQTLLASDLDGTLDKTEDTMDTLKELSEEMQTRLQMAMDRRSQAQTTMSNLMKKVSETASNIIGNLK